MAEYHTFVVRIWTGERGAAPRAQVQDLESGEEWQCTLETLGRTIAERAQKGIVKDKMAGATRLLHCEKENQEWTHQDP
jgi:hypothetical protein